MAIDVIGFAIAKNEAGQRGVGDQEATRIGVIGATMTSPILALVVARAMADKEAPATPDAPAHSSTPIILDPPAGGGQGGGTGNTGGTGTTGGTGSTGGTGTTGGTGGTGGTGSTGGTGDTGSTGGGNVPSTQRLLAHVDQARAEAGHAKASADRATHAAEEAHRAVTNLSYRVEAGFKTIEDKLSETSSPSVTAQLTRSRRRPLPEAEG
jgi:hypothetical protein